jgi:hypothetical protein
MGESVEPDKWTARAQADGWYVIKRWEAKDGRMTTRFIGPMRKQDSKTIVRALQGSDALVEALEDCEDANCLCASGQSCDCCPVAVAREKAGAALAAAK